MWQIGTLTFHAYGFIVGCAVALAWWSLDVLVQQHQQKQLRWQEWLALLVTTLLCARFWHVMTDWQWYVQFIGTKEWWRVFAVWQGGLSILGAVLGLSLSLWYFRRSNFGVWLDLLALVLPWSQAVGRLANWINQELYGLPTQLPWGIMIRPEHRVAVVRDLPLTTTFHPLFAYEAICMVVLGFWLRRQHVQQQWKPGNLKLWWYYVLGYSAVRFFLDFLRTERGPIALLLGFNQWFLLLMVMVSSFCLMRVAKTSGYTAA